MYKFWGETVEIVGATFLFAILRARTRHLAPFEAKKIAMTWIRLSIKNFSTIIFCYLLSFGNFLNLFKISPKSDCKENENVYWK